MVRKEHERHLERLQAMVEGASGAGKHKPIPPEELKFLAALEDALREMDIPDPVHRSPEDWKRVVSRALERCGHPKEQDEEIDAFLARIDKAAAGRGGG